MKLVSHALFPLISGYKVSNLSAPSDDVCKPSLWNEWTDELDCFWQENSKKWWEHSNQGNARGSSYWNDWNYGLTGAMADRYDDYDHAKYYDHKHQKACTPNGLVSISKVKSDETLAYCSDYSKTFTRTFSDARHHDAKISDEIVAINYATTYDDKARQSDSDACADGHCEWSYGDYINYDHLPAKSTYMDSCKGGSSGQNLPTVAIQAIDHKGPVWSYCTTSRSTSSDNDRKSIRKMIDYIEANQYGCAIFENLACLLAGALNMDLLTTFTDYIPGFKNLMYLHFERESINQNELELLLSFLTKAEENPSKASNDEDSFLNLIASVNTYQDPAWC